MQGLLDFLEEDKTEEIPLSDEGLAEWKKRKKEARDRMTAMQRLPYSVKKRRSELRANEFIGHMEKRGKNAHVSVGGLDSITLHVFLKSIGIHVPAISVSGLEDKSIQKIHKALGITVLQSYKTKVQVLNENGFPVISKRIAGKISLLQNPSDKNRTVRHAIITGECGELGHFAKNSRMKLPQKWLKLFGGYENENEGVSYQKPNFKVSNDCCYWLKGCSMCGFGIHMEERPHRFDRLRRRNPQEWEFYMYRCCTDPDTGEKYGWGRVLDYIGVEWEDIPPVQMSLFDLMKG